jgi:hypothetical protein
MMKVKSLFFMLLSFYSLQSFATLNIQNLWNSTCRFEQLSAKGSGFRIKATCPCQGKTGVGEGENSNVVRAKEKAMNNVRLNLESQFESQATVDCGQATPPPQKDAAKPNPQVQAPESSAVATEVRLPERKTAILDLIKQCQEPSVDSDSCNELMKMNPKFAEMVLKLNEKYKYRETLISSNPDYEANLSNRDNFELAQRLADLEYLDEKKVFEEFCEDHKGKALCLADTELAVLEEERNFTKCFNQRIAQIEIKNPGAEKYHRGAFAGTHYDEWQKEKDCKKLLASDVLTFKLDKFYDTDIEFKDFDPKTCQWFSDLPRRIIRGAVKSCQGNKRAEACVGYVVCERKEDNSKFVRQSTCSKNNCTEDRAVACTVEKNFSSRTFIPKEKPQISTPDQGVSKE